MGGLGPGYEQAIQVMVFEIIRDWIGKELPSDLHDFGDKSISRADKKLGGVSGAMAGAAKQLAYVSLRHGWAAMLNSVASDRHIQVEKRFP